jgi:type II secretory pathway component PulM
MSMAMKMLFASAIIAGAGAATAGCTTPQPPQLTPQSAAITSVDIAGFDMRVKMDAFNPNGVELSIQSVTAHVVESLLDQRNRAYADRVIAARVSEQVRDGGSTNFRLGAVEIADARFEVSRERRRREHRVLFFTRISRPCDR